MKTRFHTAYGFGVALCLLSPAVGAAQVAAESTTKRFHMELYFLVLLHRGPTYTTERSAEQTRIFQGHMENIRRLGNAGKLVVAGPFEDDGDLVGLFVFKVDSLSEAKRLVAMDPAIQSGRFRAEIHPWYAPSGLWTDATRPDSARLH